MVVDRIVVIGGGIVGASVASHLGERTDDPVVVYDSGELAAETTDKATAMIGVSDPDPYHRMQAEGIRCYGEFFGDPECSARYRHAPRLRVATTSAGAEDLVALAESTENGDQEPVDASGVGGTRDASRFENSIVGHVPGDEVDGRFVLPLLDTDRIEGALYRPEYGYVFDDSRTLGARGLAMAFVERARDRGVTFEAHTPVSDVVTDGDGVRAVEIEGETTVPAEAVVCAAGPWNHRVAAMAGVDLPIGHVLSPVFVLDLPQPLAYTPPMIKSHETGVGLHPKRSERILVTTTVTEDDVDGSIDPAGPSEIGLDRIRRSTLRTARELAPGLDAAELVDEWVGHGITTPDGKPIVGWSEVSGCMLAATRAGIQYAPAVGAIVARQLVEDDPTEYYDAVTIDRFEGYRDRVPEDVNP